MALRLQLLGGPRLSIAGEGVKLRLKNPFLLMAHLAYREAWVPRSELMTLFWPEVDEARAQNNLRQLLYQLRRYPWAGGLELEEGAVRWVIPTDVAAFQRALAAGNWAEAVARYQGELLAGVVDVPPSYGEWLEFEREAMHAAWREVATQHALALERIGRHREAAELLQRVLKGDALAEEVVTACMRTYAHAGQRELALKVFEGFKRQLWEELELAPLPETIALAEALPEASPVLAAPPRAFANAPAELAPFVGRTVELAELQAALGDGSCRLVTLLGPGGVGKSRLAAQLARLVVERESAFTHGACFVPLAHLSDAELIPQALADALGFKVKPSSADDLSGQLLTHLSDKRMLLVFDNFEHVLSGAPFVAELLTASPGSKVIATSRVMLGLSGEELYDLGGLELPPSEGAAQLESYDAVHLFLRHARRIRAGFALDAANRAALVRLCRLLAGMPLALELASRWLRLFSLEALVLELERGFALLEAERCDLPERHRSMRVVFEHSWRLLSPDEQGALSRLAVFRGGFSLEAAEAVAGAGAHTLLALVNGSLLARSPSGRFVILEVVRQYAAEKCREPDAVAARHADYYRGLAERAEGELGGPEQAGWLTTLEEEHDNMRAALAWCLKQRQAELGLRLANGLWRFWHMCGYLREGHTWFARLLALTGASAPTRAKALRNASVLAWMRGDSDLARRCLGESLQLFEALGDEAGAARVLNNLGLVAYLERDYPEANRLFEASLQRFRALNDSHNVGGALGNLGLVTFLQGDEWTARSICEEVLAIFERLGDAWSIATSLNNLARVLTQQGERARAVALYEQALELACRCGAKRLVASILEGLAKNVAASGQGAAAARLWAAAEALRETIDAPREPVDDLGYQAAVRATEAQVGARAFQCAWREGRQHPFEAAVALARDELKRWARGAQAVTQP